ncbi:MAG: universal stress protein [Parapedobacter sp.]|nr:MAG: universal stress protein [Parapedobacter sp.]
MGNILLLTDFSPGSNNAAAYALKLAKQLRFDLLLLHVTDTEDGNSTDTLQQFDKLKNSISETDAGMDNYQPALVDILVKGKLTEGIAGVLKQKDIDLVVVGATDGENKTGMLFGKRVREIIDSVQYPTLLVPSAARFKEIRDVFYVTDIRYANTQAIERLMRIVRLLKANLSVLHIGASGLPELSKQHTQSLFNELVMTVPGQLPRFLIPNQSHKPETLIRKLFVSQGQDVLAVAHREHHFFGHIFRDHHTEDAVIYKEIPMLILPV